MSDAVVREARGHDVPGIRAVADRSRRRPCGDVLPDDEVDELLGEWYSEGAPRSSVAGDGSSLYVAEREAVCVGFGEWGDRGPGPEVVRLRVDPDDAGRSFWASRGFERRPEGDRDDAPCEPCTRIVLTDPSV